MSNIDDKLFLVAIPRGELLTVAKSIQSKLNERFDIYNGQLPPLHVTIEHISANNKQEYDRAVELISNICEKKKPFELKVNGFSFFGPPYKSINLYVEKTTELKKLSFDINEALTKENLSSRPYFEEWEFHISLINTVFASREWTLSEFEEAKQLVKEWQLNMTCQVEWLELWRPGYEPHLEIEEFFTLNAKGE